MIAHDEAWCFAAVESATRRRRRTWSTASARRIRRPCLLRRGSHGAMQDRRYPNALANEAAEEHRSVSPAAWIRNAQPRAATGCGYFPIGALPTGYLPIGALPTGAAGGGGSLRGRSAAAAALSMAKDAAVTVRIFSMTNPLRVWTASLRKPRMRQPRDAPLSSHHHLARAVSTAARLKNALTAFRTQ